jgi:hypothetical protein
MSWGRLLASTPMDRPRTTRAILVSLAVVLLAACEVDGDEPTPAPSSPEQGPTETSTIEASPGSYRYEGLGVAAVLTFDGPDAELQVRNDTGVELGEPRLYLFAADDGTRIELTTGDPRPVAPGPAETFDISFDGDPVPIGMVFLRLGQEDFGAFVPVKRGAT